MLQTDLLPHTVRDHASSVVETLAQHVTAAVNREKQVQMRQAVNDLLQNDASSPCVVCSMKFDGKQVCCYDNNIHSIKILIYCNGIIKGVLERLCCNLKPDFSVCMCVCACVRMCLPVCMCVCVCVCVCV